MVKIDDDVGLEIETHFEFVSRETVEVCINLQNDEWVLAVFLEKNQNEKSKFDIQILNQDDITSVDLQSIRKFKGCDDKQMFLNLITISMGAGILSLPWTMAGSSIFPGLIFIFLSMLFVFYTCKQILESADRYNYDNMGLIIERELQDYPTISKIFKIVAICTCWISTILCLIGYYVIIWENGTSMLGDKMNATYWFIIGPCITSLLTFCPNHMLSWTSFVSLIVTILIIIALICSLANKGPQPIGEEGVHLLSIGRGYFGIIANMMMAMSIQFNMPSLYKEIQIRDVKRMTSVMAKAFGVAYVIFATTAILAYLLFGPKVKGNFLEGLGDSIIDIITKSSAMLVCVFVAPLCVLPITDDIELWINTYRMKRNVINHSHTNDEENVLENEQEDIVVVDFVDQNPENLEKDITLDIFLRIIKVIVIASPVFLAYVVKVILHKSLDLINVINGVVVLFCYCAVTPLVVCQKITWKEITLSIIALAVTILAARFSEDNYIEDLDWFNPNF